MRILIYLTTFILIFNSCSPNKLDRLRWAECKQQNSIQAFFNFGLNNSSSAYLDSSLIILNDSIKKDRYFHLIYKEDSNLFYKAVMPNNGSIRKDHIFLIDISTGNCLLNDTIISEKNTINRKLDWFMSMGFKHCVWIYSDSISSSESWITLFGKIKEILYKYNSVREKYSIDKWKVEYTKLGVKNQELLKERIPINLIISFANPIPPPPDFVNDKTE